MNRIGLTGGIGSGKSRVAAILREHSVPVFDCDSEAKKMMSGDVSVRDALTAACGVDFFVDGVPDKRRLADFLFKSEENAALVNGVIHPRVVLRFRGWCDELENSGCKVCAVESAILFESGLLPYVDMVVVVDAPEALRVERASMRDSASREKILERVRAQASQESKLAQADFVIDNSGDEVHLLAETERLLDFIFSEKNKHLND